MEFLKTQSRNAAIEGYIKKLVSRIDFEEIPLKNSVGRIVSLDQIASFDIPGFSRSIVDGYICVSGMTSGAGPGNPIPFTYGGEIQMGESLKDTYDSDKVYYIPTGAPIPKGFDAVVMIENTEKVNNTIYIEKSVFKGENIIYKGEDLKAGDKITEKGRVLRSVDIGAIASQGIESVSVYKKVKIAIIPTGKELKRAGEDIDAKSVYDVNSFMLKSLLDKFKYFETEIFRIIKDDEDDLYGLIKDNYGKFDVFVISGGSSKGMRDITTRVIEKLGSPGILIHGIDMSPGKPTILSLCNNKIVFGAPGHPVSSYISVRFVMVPILNYFAGKTDIFEKPAGRGKLKADIPSKHGLDDFIRVIIEGEEIEPIFGKSGMVSTLSKSNGIIIAENEKEGLYKGEYVDYYGII